MKVAIIDHGLCNMDSIARAIERCGGDPMVLAHPEGLESAHRIVVPGVGAFGKAMQKLEQLGFVDALSTTVISHQVPVLGICLGMQLMLAIGEEGGTTAGLGWVDGHVRRLVPSQGERVPHIGWNTVEFDESCPLFHSLAPNTDFYFVHSYHVTPDDPSVIVGRTPFAGGFASAIRKGSLYGVQFHPEKSQTAGFTVLENFLRCGGQ
jgi:imidazole glycerol-phosphate synthase subunit HisH